MTAPINPCGAAWRQRVHRQSPRFAIEAFGMVLIAALAYGLSRQPGGVSTALPVLAALALGAQRLLPALHKATAHGPHRG